ncbi:MAG: hypothetical protein WA633_03230 [Stellaceae bacterium]
MPPTRHSALKSFPPWPAAEAGAPVGTERERQHVAAIAAWAGGALDRSFGIWQQLLDAYPTDLLAARICDTSWFRHG